MATRKKRPFPGLFTITAKGKAYHYAWRNGPRIFAEYGTPDFAREFAEARSPESNLDRGKFGAWVALYKASPSKRGRGRAYRELADATRRNWDPLLDEVQRYFGALPVRLFDRPSIKKDIRHWRDKWAGTPRMADLAKQVLSRVCSFMVSEGVLSSNPCEGIESLYENDRSEIIWSDADLDALCAAASPEVALAARLASLTGLRQGDLLRLSWSRVNDLAIELKTGKSRGRRSAVIPMYGELRALLASIPKRASTVLTNTYGRPWKSGFGASWQAALDRAGLGERDLHFHDLRGTAATKFYRAGFTSREIADILGWSQENVERLLDMYVRRDDLLRDRIARLERFEDENRKIGSKT